MWNFNVPQRPLGAVTIPSQFPSVANGPSAAHFPPMAEFTKSFYNVPQRPPAAATTPEIADNVLDAPSMAHTIPFNSHNVANRPSMAATTPPNSSAVVNSSAASYFTRSKWEGPSHFTLNQCSKFAIDGEYRPSGAISHSIPIYETQSIHLVGGFHRRDPRTSKGNRRRHRSPRHPRQNVVTHLRVDGLALRRANMRRTALSHLRPYHNDLRRMICLYCNKHKVHGFYTPRYCSKQCFLLHKRQLVDKFKIDGYDFFTREVEDYYINELTRLRIEVTKLRKIVSFIRATTEKLNELLKP
jgi:hypothetical protein